jgi:hypothetical protein
MDEQERQWLRERFKKAQMCVWPENKIRPNNRMSRETLAAIELAAEQHPDAANFLTRLRAQRYRVNSLEWHAFKYRYQYQDTEATPEELNARFDRVLADSDAKVLKSGNRVWVFSSKEQRLAIIDDQGRRVSVHRPDKNTLAEWERSLWTVTDLHD